jgi:glucosamine kinase
VSYADENYDHLYLWSTKTFYVSICRMKLALGVDAGGTASRAVVATPDGEILARGSAGPGNPTAAGPEAAKSIGTAVSAALHGLDPASVFTGVVGVAGVSILADPQVAAAFSREWAAIGLTCPIAMVGDAVTAFAAGTPAESGAVLIAGTGAVAARIENRTISGTADGLGWLLCDEGSGLWLGLQAVRAVARAWPLSTAELAHRGPRPAAPTQPPPSPSGLEGLAAEVAAHAGVGSRDELVQWAGRQTPSAFAALAPLVCASAVTGDPIAVGLTTEAATRLAATLAELGPHNGPVVLAGGLLAANTPVRKALLAILSGPVTTSRDPAVGAAWLALRDASSMDDHSAALLHARLLPAT